MSEPQLSIEQSFTLHSFNSLVDGITSLEEAKKLLKELHEQKLHQKISYDAMLKKQLIGEFQKP